MNDHQWVVEYVQGFLEAHGFMVEGARMTGCNHDLLVDQKVRVEVLACRKPMVRGMFKFNISRKAKADLYVFAAWVGDKWEYSVVLGQDAALAKGRPLWFKATEGRTARACYSLLALPRLVKRLRGRAGGKQLRVGLKKTLDATDKKALRKLYATGSYTLRYLGWRFGVSRTRVWQILRA